MNFREARKSKGWIVLLASVLGISIGGYSFINNAMTNHVYTVNCGQVDYKPKAFLKVCGDQHVAISDIQWDSWSADGARGKAVYVVNDCNPTCASGMQNQVEVNVVLTGNTPLDIVRSKSVLNRLEISSVDKKPLPLSGVNRESWNLT
jgi:hypothetical protein